MGNNKPRVLLTASYGPNELGWGEDMYDLHAARLGRGPYGVPGLGAVDDLDPGDGARTSGAMDRPVPARCGAFAESGGGQLSFCDGRRHGVRFPLSRWHELAPVSPRGCTSQDRGRWYVCFPAGPGRDRIGACG